ncbi:MAG: beta-galactosidase [Pyrinomonadaceae bacterium]|nr:beta-galactosidase [Sphingobacteriaceae bacterium]
MAQQKFIGANKIYYGVSYYPELWDESCLDTDIERMKDLHMNVVRMGEFAWSKMELREGVYDFKWLHRVIDKLHKNGIDVILGTPSATPPNWMWEKYPDIARIGDDGLKSTSGARRNTNYTNPIYIAKSIAIAEAMAIEFGKNPGVIAWQIDNEFNFDFDYSTSTNAKWQSWLQDKYKSIDRINRLWVTDLWSQTYTSFSQIPMPSDRTNHHPSLRFAWTEFMNDVIVAFQYAQIAAIKKHSKLPITHDTMPGQRVDYEKLTADEDFGAVNNYHNYKIYDRVVSNYDRMRALGKGYWLFETTPNYSGGNITWFNHEPMASVRAALWMNYALGGQGSMFWLWRQQPAGQEMAHGAIYSTWNKPAANYDIINQLGSELEKTSSFLMGNPVMEAKIGIFYSHQSENGLRVESIIDGLKYYTDWSNRFYQPIQDAYLHRDVIYPSHNLDNYKLIIAPLMPYMGDDLKRRLKIWVQKGGILIIGPMTGYRTNDWTAFTDYATGDLETWTGVQTESRIPLALSEHPQVSLLWNDALKLGSTKPFLISDALSSKNGKVLATYKGSMHDKKPAIIECAVGKGKVVTLGTDPGKDALTAIYLKYAQELEIETLASGDKGVLVVPRGNDKVRGVILVNLTEEDKSILLNKKFNRTADLITGHSLDVTKITLKPFEIQVLQIK